MKIRVVKPSEIKDKLIGETVGFDIETSGLEIDRRITMMSFYHKPSKSKYVVPIYTDEYIMPQDEKHILREILSSIKVIGQFLQFDCSKILYDFGIFPEVVGDTFILARIFQKQKQSIKDLFKEYYPQFANKVSKFGDVLDIPKDGSDITYSLSNPGVVYYSGLDAVMPVVVEERMKEHKLYEKIKHIYELELGFLSEVIRIRTQGIIIDYDKYQETVSEFSNRFYLQLDDFYRKVGRSVKINSSADLRKLLFEELNLPIPPIKTKTGAISTSAEALEMIKDEDPIISELVELKHTDSVLRSIKTLPKYMIGNKVHPTIEQIGYDGTSRVYSSDPSVNQFPIELRESILPNPGKKFVYMDWSSAELYISAYWSKCRKILDWYHSGQDLHANVAEMLLGRPIKDKKEREVSKVVSFATIYGSTGGAVSRSLKCSQQEGENYVRTYLNEFAEIKNLRDKIQEYTKKTTYTKTIFGRPRRLPLVLSYSSREVEKALRQSFNTAIQGSCSDFFKSAVIKSKKYNDIGVEVRFGVFDSIILEVPIEMKEEEYRKICADLSDFSDKFKGFKFRFSCAEGSNWREAQDKA